MSELALKLIAEAKEKRLTILDLGKCGLTEVPEALFELVWLEELSLSNMSHNKIKKGARVSSKNTGANNQLSELPQSFFKLQQLKKLVVSGTYDYEWKISDVSALSKLSMLTTLDLSYNQISNVSMLSKRSV